MIPLNLGIVAHVDAGKTSLTERLLYQAGVIPAIGSVDRGSTQTDTTDQERRRGITIQSAVVAFAIDDLPVNLIDTPGHSDFIAEVERALRVLDGVVLVVSAVEGVQAQTRKLMRTVAALGIPTLIFVNKIDRVGARDTELLAELAAELSVRVLPLATVTDLGGRGATAVPVDIADPTVAETLADGDDAFLRDYLERDGDVEAATVTAAITEQTARGVLRPVYFGSAATGTGVAALAEGIRRHLRPAAVDATAPPHGTVFKVERGPAGEKIAYARMRTGTLAARDRVAFHRRGPDGEHHTREQKLTAVRVFERGAATRAATAGPGDIARLWGPTDVRIGDAIGTGDAAPATRLFARPTLETVVSPAEPRDRLPLQAALRQLAERDPLVEPHFDETGHDITVNLYGEVQKEVIAATLAEEFGIAVGFDATRTLHIERVTGVGEAVEEMGPDAATHFYATIGLRVEPAEPGSGVTYRLAVERGSLLSAMRTAVAEMVHVTLRQGLYGWPVPDVVVTLTRSGYMPPASTPAEFRKLTPFVLMRALSRAGTQVCEPVNRFELDIPEELMSGAMVLLAESEAELAEPGGRDGSVRLTGTIPVRTVREVELRLPGVTQGRGGFVSVHEGYRPVSGPTPTRTRTDGNPLDRDSYLRHLNSR